MRTTAAMLALLCALLVAGFEVLHSDGYTGGTRKNGFGCICHGFSPSAGVTVWIEGPASVSAGSITSYALYMRGGPAVEGGFNVASDQGSFSAPDTFSQVIGDELTHIRPKRFAGDTVQWVFRYHAPAAATVDSLYSVANSVNDNGRPDSDAWNYGASLAVTVTPDTTTDAFLREELPLTFALEQNYPNPFNPATTIRFHVAKGGLAMLEVFTPAGQRVATPFSGPVGPGTHEVIWDAAGLPSGVYLSTLTSGGRAETRKMLLIR